MHQCNITVFSNSVCTSELEGPLGLLRTAQQDVGLGVFYTAPIDLCDM